MRMRINNGESIVTIVASKTAILVMHGRADFLRLGGVLYRYFSGYLEKCGVVNNIVSLLDGARDKANIFHIISNSWAGDTPGQKVLSELTPKSCDIIIETNLSVDVFYSTPLNDIFRVKQIYTVVFCGFFYTDWGVESAASFAGDRGYQVVIVSDCTSISTEREQKYSEEVISLGIGKVMPSAQFLAALK
jgi:nicotinamidase-related amidase